MPAGELTDPMTLEEKINGSWTSLGTVFGRIEGGAGSREHVITLRYREMGSNEFRLLYRDRTFDVYAVNYQGRRSGYLEVLCNESTDLQKG